MQSPAGELLRHAASIESAVTAHYSVEWMELSIEEARAIETIREERDRWNREQQAIQSSDQLMRQVKGIPITNGK
jgi:hypothetical protein